MTAVPARLTDEHRKMLGRFVARVVEFLEAEIDYSGGESYGIHPRSLGGHAVTVRLFVFDTRGMYCLDVAFAMEECVSEDGSRADSLIDVMLKKALYGLRKRPLPTPETTR
jgi:hypothetical protein